MKWNILSKEHESNKTPEQITAALLKNRGMTTTSQIDQFLHPSLNQLEREFFNHNQLTKAIDRINKAILHQEQIIVYSDYDVDGITGTAILWETLHRLGATAMPFVPDRFRHGYGLSQKGIDT